MSSNWFKGLVLVGSLFCVLPAQAEIVTVNSQGIGHTREMARASALKEAIMQVSGVSVDSETLQHLVSDESVVNNKVDSKFREQQEQLLKERIQGVVSGFRVVNESTNPDGSFTMQLEVDIEKYDIPGVENKRRSISVQAFEAGTPGVCFGKKISQQDQIKAITEAVQTAFVTSRKFAILDRHSQVYQQEKDFINSDNAKVTEQAKLGLNRGSDYIVTGNVRHISIAESKRKMQLSNAVHVNRYARGDYVFNLMMFATREIQLSANVAVKLNENLSGLSCQEILARLSQKAASEITKKATLSIYPPKVINTVGRMIYFNYGGDEVKIGDTFNLYSEGEAIYDPYTKEPLGNVEELIGLVKVIEVKPKYSVATWVDSEQRAPVKVGDILRPYQELKKAKVAPKKKLKSKVNDEW